MLRYEIRCSCNAETLYAKSPTMRKYLFLIIPSFFLASCHSGDSSTAEQATVAQPNICTLVFMDKSLSVNLNRTFVNEKYSRILGELIDQNIRQKGDRIEVYFIHENTSKAKAMEAVCQSEMEDLTNVNATDNEAIRTAFNLSLKKERIFFRQRALAQLAVQNTSASNQATDIWASLSVIDRAVGQGFVTKAYYLSDMIESMKGTGRRDFHTTPPHSQAQAEDWAKTDAEQLKSKLNNLPSADIKLALPFEPTSTTKQNNPNVTAYWQILFKELGVVQEVSEMF